MLRRLVLPATVIAVLAIALAVLYLAIPADALPVFIPGADPDLARRHTKRAAELLLVGAALLIFAWVELDPPRPAREEER